ncbi:hypothetical protein BJ878DRAFT_83871 [Calycina marina]|uniref:DNA/RNA-binding protein Alba-like domain-containing protein n=1 Tax=Calycina marina TaxID=1763456 RepID=A0A9P7ZA38_9HELO|nr:hypothetical protein BJ878DRAFT_83871 [Calycina marina]
MGRSKKRLRDPSSSSQPQSKKTKSAAETTTSQPSSSQAQRQPESASNPSQATSTPVAAKSVDLSAYNVSNRSILSSSSIQKRTTQVLNSLKPSAASVEDTFIGDGESKQMVVQLHANSKAASKLITVVEIVKRELAASKTACFQYTCVEGIMKEQTKKVKDSKHSGAKDSEKDAEKDDEDEEDNTEGFETMKTPFERSIEGVPKIRTVPMLTIWLSNERVGSLARKFGDQSNGVELGK